MHDLDPNPRNNIYPGVMYVGPEQMVLPFRALDPNQNICLDML